MVNNLNVPQVAASQNQKEVTINTATVQLGQAVTAYFPIDLTANTGYTLTAANYQSNLCFQLQNGTISQTITFPVVQRALVLIRNETADDHTIAVGTTNITLPAGMQGVFQTDGTANGLVLIALFANTGQTESLRFFAPGVYTASQLIASFIFDRAVTFPASLTGSEFDIDVNPTATMVVTIEKNGVSVGSISFSTAGAPTVTFAAATSFAIGDKMTIHGPASPDATGAGIAGSLLGSLA